MNRSCEVVVIPIPQARGRDTPAADDHQTQDQTRGLSDRELQQTRPSGCGSLGLVMPLPARSHPRQCWPKPLPPSLPGALLTGQSGPRHQF